MSFNMYSNNNNNTNNNNNDNDTNNIIILNIKHKLLTPTYHLLN